MFVFPLFGPDSIMIVAGFNVPSISLSFVSISIQIIVSSSVIAVSSLAVGGVFFSSSFPMITEGFGSIVKYILV